MKNYLKFWKNIFHYKGTASFTEFCGGFHPTVLVAVLALLNSVGYWIADRSFTFLLDEDVWMLLAQIFVIVTILHLVPMLSLAVRTLRGKKKNVWWSLLVLVIGVGWIMLASLCMNGSFLPGANVPACVYGPPEWFNPSYNENVDVYGPPAFDVEEDEEDSLEEESSGEEIFLEESLEDFDPETNVMECIYGPPEMFEE